ncbi:MAG: endonuclease/exonuclease/phosphatase family protein [Muribaculaceae bacterium]|nr:endonuclease/exonuclease/phosphatase family protein [Muribaculaceae bacterium]
MKRLALILMLVLATAGILSAQNNKRQYAVYGVAFYNLENLFDTINNNGKYDLEFSPQGARQWNGTKYWSKIGNMARAITAMTTKTTPGGPAVIGVSEIENETVLNDLVREVDRQLEAQGKATWNLQVVHHDSPDRRGVDVACLYNPRMFRFIDVTNTTLRIDGYESFRTRDQMCVTGILGDDTLSVIVNHWPSRLGGQEQSSYLREAAAALSKHIADSLWTLRPNQGVIVMGDLNDDPQDKSCAKVLGAQRKPDKVEPHGFYNPFWEKLDKGIGTLAYRGSWNLFDQIIVSGTLLEKHNPDALQYRSCVVNNFEFLRSTEGTNKGGPLRTYSGGVFLNGYSDHFPTEVFLVKPRR